MARTPLAGAVQDAVAEIAAGERRTTRARFVKEAGIGAIGLTALGRLAAPARGAAAPKIVVVGAGLAGLSAAYQLKQAGYAAEVHEAADAARRPLLDVAQRVRRGTDRRARWGADRPEPLARTAACAGTRAQARQPAPGGAERDGALRVLRRLALLLRGDDRRHQGRMAEDPCGRLGGQLSDHLRDLDRAGTRARQDVDRRLDRGDIRGRDRVADREAARRRLQHRVRRRMHGAERAQPALPARLLRPGPVPSLRAVEREVPRRRRQRPDHRPTRGAARRPDHDRIGARRRAPERLRHVHAHVRAADGHEDRHRRQGRPRAAVLDPALVRRPLARPASSH